MPLPPQHSHNDLSSLKSQIVRKLGLERAQRYFGYLKRLLGRKLSKYEFDKLCFATLGQENISLHNRLIRSILRNAYQGRAGTPVVHDKDNLKPNRAVGEISPSTDDGSRPSPANIPATTIWSNGDILSPSLCKSRSTNRRIKDGPIPLRPNGKVDSTAYLRVPLDEAFVRENGDLIPCDLKMVVQHRQRGLVELSMKQQRVEKSSPCQQVSADSKDPAELIVVEDREEVEQTESAESNGCPLRAPLGIPFCPASIGGARRPAPLPASNAIDGIGSNYYSGMLCHTEHLRKRMEHIAEAQGLGGVSMDCANLLNNGLDAYLKRLVRACVDLVGERSGHEPIKHPAFKQQTHMKNLNGICLGNHMHIQSTVGILDGMQEPINHHQLSMLDFRLVMELSPQILGEDWPLLLEKVCHRSFEE